MENTLTISIKEEQNLRSQNVSIEQKSLIHDSKLQGGSEILATMDHEDKQSESKEISYSDVKQYKLLTKMDKIPFQNELPSYTDSQIKL